MIDITKWKINKHEHKKLLEYDNKIVTRFPPEPSGYLHIGHAKAIFINYVIAKKYHGQMLLRFDDTNPLNESEEYVEAIQDDIINLLKIQPDRISRSSDHFDQLLNFADHLVQTNQAYIDFSSAHEIADQKRNKTSSIYRDLNTLLSNDIWTKMKQGIIKSAVLRLKINAQHKHDVMRDPIIYRHLDVSESSFHVFPTYDYACPIVDSIEGVTHVYRSVEFSDRDILYTHILNLLDFDPIVLNNYSKVEFTNALC